MDLFAQLFSSMTWDSAVVAGVVGCSLFFFARRILKMRRRSLSGGCAGCSCGDSGGCSGCSGKHLEPLKLHPKEE